MTQDSKTRPRQTVVGVAVAIGAGIGIVVGVIIGGGAGVAIGAALGAGMAWWWGPFGTGRALGHDR